MSANEQGSRVGGYVWIIDEYGLRHAVRPSSANVLSDADPTRDETIVQVGSGRMLRVVAPLEQVIDWFQMGGGR